MTKKTEIQAYLLEHKRGDTVRMRGLKFELWDNAQIRASKSTIRSALAEMRDEGRAEIWGGGRTVRWYINRNQPPAVAMDEQRDSLDKRGENDAQ